MLTYASEACKQINRDRKKMRIFERRVYRGIVGPTYDKEKENWRIVTLRRQTTYIYVSQPFK